VAQFIGRKWVILRSFFQKIGLLIIAGVDHHGIHPLASLDDPFFVCGDMGGRQRRLGHQAAQM
jgi:hypothetical protein